jgi:hypothetical protein
MTAVRELCNYFGGSKHDDCLVYYGTSIAQRIESHRIVLSPHDDELYCFVTCTCTGYILYDPRNTWMNYTTLLLVGLIDSSMEEDPWLSLCGVEPAHTTGSHDGTNALLSSAAYDY